MQEKCKSIQQDYKRILKFEIENKTIGRQEFKFDAENVDVWVQTCS